MAKNRGKDNRQRNTRRRLGQIQILPHKDDGPRAQQVLEHYAHAYKAIEQASEEDLFKIYQELIEARYKDWLESQEVKNEERG